MTDRAAGSWVAKLGLDSAVFSDGLDSGEEEAVQAAALHPNDLVIPIKPAIIVKPKNNCRIPTICLFVIYV